MNAAEWGKSRADQAWTAAVLERYGRVCLLRLDGCTTIATTGDHVIPKSRRPDLMHSVSNGRPACRPCNSKRGDAPLPRVVLVDDRDFFESSTTRVGQALASPPRAPTKNAGSSPAEHDEGRPVLIVDGGA